MIVRMLVGISGSRDDSAWPPVNGKLEVSDAEGQDLINAGLAVDTGETKPDDPEPEPEPEPDPEPDPEPEPVKDEPVDEAEPEQGQEAGGPPKPAASKQDWIDYAVSQGAKWVTATNATKQQLMEQYGQRP